MAKTYIEQTLETLVELVDLARKQSDKRFDHVNESFEQVNKSIDNLAVNVGQLAVQQRQAATNIDRLGERIERLITAVERQNAAIDGHLRLSEAQSTNIAELTRLATKLIEKSA